MHKNKEEINEQIRLLTPSNQREREREARAVLLVLHIDIIHIQNQCNRGEGGIIGPTIKRFSMKYQRSPMMMIIIIIQIPADE